MDIDWEKLLCEKRLNEPEKRTIGGVNRTPFKRDYARVLYSSAFRRLQDKTQVFPIGRNDYVRTRLTHSLEVANVGSVLARTLAGVVFAHSNVQTLEAMEKIIENMANMEDITITACLAHDIGNPPFGHSGEDAINYAANKFIDNHRNQEWVNDLPTRIGDSGKLEFVFEGNAQGLRQLVKLCDTSRGSETGLDLTVATLASFIKYPCTLETKSISNYKKAGVYKTELSEFERISSMCGLVKSDGTVMRHPLAYLMEAADDISYVIADIEDAYASGIIDYNDAVENLQILCDESFDVERTNNVVDRLAKVRLARSNAINNCIQNVARYLHENFEKLFDGRQGKNSLMESCDEFSEKYCRVCKFSQENIYSHKRVLMVEVTGYMVISYLVELFLEWVVSPSSQLGEKIQTIIHAPNYRDEDYAKRFMKVIDYVSGMTDSYALQMYQTLGGFKSR